MCKTYNLKLWNMYLSKGLKIEHFLSPTRFVDLVLNSVINPLKSADYKEIQEGMQIAQCAFWDPSQT